jgi:acetyl esterase/lipase
MRLALAILLVIGFVVPALAQRPGQKAAELRDKIAVESNVEYAKAGDISLKLDVLKPKAESDKPRPAIVWIHGGGWQNGDKASGLGRLGGYVAGGDYVGVSVGYRLTDKGSWPAQIHDCKAAIRWVRANAEKLGIDPERIGVWGSSAGGHLVAHLGSSGDVKEVEGDLGTPSLAAGGVSSRVACVVDFCGPSDFPNFQITSGARSPIIKLLGGLPPDKPEAAKEASPITYVTKDDPPFLIVHGTDDRTVPFNQGERFHEAQKKAGVDTTFVKIEGGGHGIGGPEVERRVRAFFEKHLLGKEVQVSGEPIKQAPRQ